MSFICSVVIARGSLIVWCSTSSLHSLVLGGAYERLADSTCSATTIRNRRDEWIAAGVFVQLEQICLDAYDRIVGLGLSDLTVDGCIVKAPCGGEASGKPPVDQRKAGYEAFAAG